MYDGPIIDAFLHSPWIGGCNGPVPRADVVPWSDDPRLKRVMHTFHHGGDGDAAGPPQMPLETVLAAMDGAGVTSAILVAKVYYPSTPDWNRSQS